MKSDKLSEKISKLRSIGPAELQDGIDLIDYLSSQIINSFHVYWACKPGYLF